jgi:putative holliday junction resolvase
MADFTLNEFIALLPAGGRLLGLDVGTKTIGLALCDQSWVIASPAETIQRTKFTADVEKMRLIIKRERCAGLVIGLPLNLDGSDSTRTQSVRTFKRLLSPLIPLPTLFWDERWSTMAVTRTLIDADTTRARRAELVDKMAAAYILQGAIDALRHQLPEE